jgi:altronate dehydratase
VNIGAGLYHRRVGTSGAPRALLMDSADNVAVAAAVLEPGEELDLGGRRVTVTERIPFGHKLALERIAEGGHVVKYGEVIGVATAPIEPGRHVHVQNVVSARLPGR